MLKILIIGCGRISETHIKALKDNSNYCIVGVCDVVVELAQKKGEELGVNYYTDYKTAIKESNCDIILIGVWSGLHPEIATFALENKKHVITEKPIGLTLKETKLMIKTAKDNDKKVFVIEQNRLNETIEFLREAIENKRFGKIYSISTKLYWSRPQSYYSQNSWRGTWKYDGGAFSNQACHYIDMMYYLGGNIKKIYAKTTKLARDIETEDSGNAIFEFENGIRGDIGVSMLAYGKNREGSITIIGEKGYVKIGGTSLNEIEEWDFENISGNDLYLKGFNINHENVYGNGHKKFFEYVYDDIINKKHHKELPNGEDGLKVLEIILGIYESSLLNKEIELPLKDDCEIEKFILERRF